MLDKKDLDILQEISNEHYLISSILTKEQFESMEYKIESEVN